MKTLLLILPFLFTTPNADKIIGDWVICNKSKSAVISINKNNDSYEGKIIWLPDDKQKDIHNPKKDLKNKILMDKVIIKGLKYVGNNKYENGTLYDPKTGKTYGCEIIYTKESLEVWVHLQSFSWLGKTQIWPLYKSK